jgi:hypothetical protein
LRKWNNEREIECKIKWKDEKVNVKLNEKLKMK